MASQTGCRCTIHRAATDQFVPRKAVTVEQLCADWLASLHNARATTIAGYTFVLAPLRERHGSLPAQKLTRPDLDDLLAALRAGGTTTAKGRARKPWSPRSLNAAVDARRLVLAYGIDRRELAHNAAAGMKKFTRQRKEMQTYTPAEINRVLKAADKDRNGHCWWLALNGLRRGEIAGLMWSDIDFEGRTLTVARNRVELGGGPTTVVQNEPKTEAARRTLPLDEGLWGVLKRASARQAGERLALGAAYADSGYVACTEAGQPYTPGALTICGGRSRTLPG
jgi:integrase